jgi:hypothetical protein
MSDSKEPAQILSILILLCPILAVLQTSKDIVRLSLENYTFLTTRVSALRTNVYAGPKRPFLRGFSNNEENQVFSGQGLQQNGDASVERGPRKAILQAG